MMKMHSQQADGFRLLALRGRTLLTTAILVVLGLAVSAHAQPRVVVSIEPYRDAVQRLLGDDATVEVLLPPGASPHAYDPTPRQVAGLADADLVIVNGGLDGWVLAMVDALGGDVPVFVAIESLPLSELVAGDHEHDHDHADDEQRRRADEDHADEEHADEEHADEEHAEEDRADVPASYGDVNPHVWLDPGHMRTIVAAIAERLSELDPARADAIAQRSATYLAELDALDTEIARTLAPVAGAPFVPFHDAWPYFAAHFGLDLIVEIEPFPGREPTARELADAIDTIQRAGAAAVFSEVQLAERAARVLADEAGVRLGVLDPIGGAPGRRSYAELLRYNAAVILEALRPDADRP
ncbi:MAG: metal ABC transporter substrate-binding protein [Trueperaceae bacterium]|nr:metal ABC transporter substrate-binding protein [Trueperaceae bacterium]